MRLKVILFMLTLGLLGGLSACSSEEPIDSQTLDMSLVLLMGDIQTKASAPNYKYATTEEIMIQNCHVAVFDTDGNRIHFQDFANMGDMKAIDNLSGYELGLVGVRTFGKEDKAVSVLWQMRIIHYLTTVLPMLIIPQKQYKQHLFNLLSW